MAKVWTRHATGIKSKVRKRDGTRIFYAEVWCNGKRCTEKAGTTERQAIKKLGAMQAAVDNGSYRPPALRKQAERIAAAVLATERANRPTFAQFAETYMADNKSRWKRLRWHEDMIAALVRIFGDTLLVNLTRASIRSDLAPMHETPSKHNRHLRYLRTMLRYAVEGEMIPKDPSAGIKYDLEPERDETDPLTPEQDAAMVEGSDAEFRPALRTAQLTGMRWCEIDDVFWSDVNLQQRVIAVTRSKNKASNRKVPMPAELVELFMALPKGDGPVFTWQGERLILWSENGTCTRRYYRPWRKAAKAAGVKAAPHVTRHTFITNYLASGGDMFVLARIVGHRDLKMLQERYGHLERGWVNRALEPVERFAGDVVGDAVHPVSSGASGTGTLSKFPTSSVN